MVLKYNTYKKIFKILDKREKSFFLILLFLILINATFETIGIAAIVPLLSLIIEDDFLNKYSFMSNFLLNVSEFFLPQDFFKNNKPDYVIILAWHLVKRITTLLTEKGYKGSFIVPLPNLRIFKGKKIS